MKYFGTDGFRGKANESLTATHAFQVGKAYGYALVNQFNNPIVLIGKDTRLSSSMLEHALAAGFSSVGVRVHLLGVIPTPAVSYLTSTSEAVGAVMVSASHNPYYDNGLKLFNEFGEKVKEDVEATIEQYIEGLVEIKDAAFDHIGEIMVDEAAVQTYLTYLHDNIVVNLKGKKIVLDCAHGATVTTALQAFEKTGAQLIVCANTPDGYNINDEVGSTHLDYLKEQVLLHQADAGFAFDGDGDRCLAIDHAGNEVNGDHMLYFLGKYFKQQGKLKNNLVVSTVMANLGLFKALAAQDVEVLKTKVGDKYVYEEMVNKDGIIGGEQSGHIIYRTLARTGDGVLTALLVASLMDQTGQSLQALCQGLTIYPQRLKNLRVKDKQAVLQDPQIQKYFEEISQALGNDGRLVVRPSGTEPLFRVMVEAPSQQQCDKLVDEIISHIQERGF